MVLVTTTSERMIFVDRRVCKKCRKTENVQRCGYSVNVQIVFQYVCHQMLSSIEGCLISNDLCQRSEENGWLGLKSLYFLFQIWNLSIKTTQLHFKTTVVTTVSNHQPVIHWRRWMSWKVTHSTLEWQNLCRLNQLWMLSPLVWFREW